MEDKDNGIEELHKEVQQYQKIIDSLHEGYLLVDRDAHIRDVNPSYCRMLGYTKEELLSMTLLDLRPGKSLSFQKKQLEDIIDSGAKEFETQHQTKDGDTVYLRVSAAVVKMEDKTVVAALLRDVTESRLKQERLKETRQRYWSLFENNPHPVYYMDLKGNYLGVNPKMLKLTGYSREELLQLNFSTLISDEDLAITQKHFEQAVKGEVRDYEITGVTKQGKRKPVQVKNFPMIVDGEVVGVFGIAEDITEQKEFERKLVESEERWHRLVEENPQSVILTADDHIIYINKAGAEMLGSSDPEVIIGRSKFEFVHPDYEDIVDNHLENSLIGEKQSASEQKIIDLDGKVKDVLIHSVPVKYKGKEAIQSVFHDITERKRKEEIIQASLQEKKVMLQEIHHRVKNNMAVVSGLLELQAMNTDDGNMQRILKDSQLRIHSMAMIHEKLYASSALSKINFNEYIRELSQTIISSTQTSREQISVRYQLDSIEMSINQAIPCGLILNELIVNAFKHAFNHQQAGTILIGLRKKESSIMLWVEDNGIGLPDDFDIADQDSLGMTLINTLTRQIEGDLTIKTGENSIGSCFKVTFQAS